ncbi:TPA: hypothetical protein PFD71_003170 [Vibrio cholerae]|nr:hypothetical protein [Vibrio cholerae]
MLYDVYRVDRHPHDIDDVVETCIGVDLSDMGVKDLIATQNGYLEIFGVDSEGLVYDKVGE